MRSVPYLVLTLVLMISAQVWAATVEPEFMPYVRQVRSDILIFCDKDEFQYKNFTILFADLKGPNVGICSRDSNGFLILVDQGSWQNMNEALRYELLAHELSHCMLHMNHSQNTENYMYPILRPNLTIDETRTQMFFEIGHACSSHSKSTMSLQRIKMFLGF